MNTKIKELKELHDRELKEFKDTNAKEHTEIKDSITDLKSKHDGDVNAIKDLHSKDKTALEKKIATEKAEILNQITYPKIKKYADNPDGSKSASPVVLGLETAKDSSDNKTYNLFSADVRIDSEDKNNLLHLSEKEKSVVVDGKEVKVKEQYMSANLTWIERN